MSANCPQAPDGWQCILKWGHDGDCDVIEKPEYTEEEAEAVLAEDAVVVLPLHDWVNVVSTVDAVLLVAPDAELDRIVEDIKRQVAEDPSNLDD